MRVATIRDESNKQVDIHIKRIAYNGRWEWRIIIGNETKTRSRHTIYWTRDEAYAAVGYIWGYHEWQLTWL